MKENVASIDLDSNRSFHYLPKKEEEFDDVEIGWSHRCTRLLKVWRFYVSGKREGEGCVPVTWRHEDKSIGEWSGSALFQFNL